MLNTSAKTRAKTRWIAPLATYGVGLLLLASAGAASAQVRMEMRPVETVTLSNQQFLSGEKNGKAVLLAGELRIPLAASGQLPAVILIHGSDGLGERDQWWARELNSIGLATFLLDSFSGRGIRDTISDQSQLDNVAMIVDAYRALGMLAIHPRIDPGRIAIMGSSKGAVAAVYSSNERFRRRYAPAGVRFAAHIGLYTPCNTAYREDTVVTGSPIRLFHGLADDYVSVEPCRAYVERLKGAGADVALTTYPGAYHSYDAQRNSTEPLLLPQAVTSRNCQLEEGDGGVILNGKTREPYNPKTDACVERGAHVGFNQAATTATLQAVKGFLMTTFHLQR